MATRRLHKLHRRALDSNKWWLHSGKWAWDRLWFCVVESILCSFLCSYETLYSAHKQKLHKLHKRHMKCCYARAPSHERHVHKGQKIRTKLNSTQVYKTEFHVLGIEFPTLIYIPIGLSLCSFYRPP